MRNEVFNCNRYNINVCFFRDLHNVLGKRNQVFQWINLFRLPIRKWFNASQDLTEYKNGGKMPALGICSFKTLTGKPVQFPITTFRVNHIISRRKYLEIIVEKFKPWQNLGLCCVFSVPFNSSSTIVQLCLVNLWEVKFSPYALHYRPQWGQIPTHFMLGTRSQYSFTRVPTNNSGTALYHTVSLNSTYSIAS